MNKRQMALTFKFAGKRTLRFIYDWWPVMAMIVAVTLIARGFNEALP